ncbi:hypothetical protein GCM10023115_15350 [Pontixanthobacter gangjinensis]|uniref:Avidin family protein n=1 Tax=Pontixanthobacter gangjinensis TaxID=1028742 RepID=A0A6I4SMV9_9SPHN|nr:hypothetical protein [Pontixanthobacter gangjinensis]MXO56778.1 hypothetical protein [Pontixanthobacter gangjinensis]
MKKFAIGAAVAASMLFGGTAFGQSFTYDVTWEPVETVGGMDRPGGTQYGGGVVDGTYVSSVSDGTTSTGSVRCVGMDQPDGEIFDIHLACTTTEAGASASLIYGCNFIGERGPDAALGCVGSIQGKTGETKGRTGGLTMEWYSETKSRGTGQWYGE